MSRARTAMNRLSLTALVIGLLIYAGIAGASDQMGRENIGDFRHDIHESSGDFGEPAESSAGQFGEESRSGDYRDETREGDYRQESQMGDYRKKIEPDDNYFRD